MKKILGIETSCDETAAAIVQNGTKVISSVVTSSEEIHKKYGGIIPEQAAREQLKSILPIIKEATEKNNIKEVEAIAVTVGPGLIGSLLVGVETAKTLAWLHQKPIIPVNHLVAHIYGNFLATQVAIKFPTICLIVSGGHTELVLMKDHGKLKWLGGTRDDAAGEAFDKTARLLGLGYPGGPAIAEMAKKNKIKTNFKLPRPMIHEDNLDFSFSGLKTAVLHQVKSKKQPVSLLAYEIQEAITEVLVKKTLKAAEKYKTESIIVGGGVAANDRLREKFQSSEKGIKIFFPKKEFCTDNAATIASAAFFNYQPVPWQKIKADPGLEIV